MANIVLPSGRVPQWVRTGVLGLVAALAAAVARMGPAQAASETPPAAPTYNVLYSFTGGADGANPYASLIRDSAGNLYGTTLFGGTSGFGVVFKLDPTGKETVLHSFTGGVDGGLPYAGLIQDRAGNRYGTTASGGTYGWGVVFKLDATGKETVLYSFTGGADGAGPRAGLIRDGLGRFYGTTASGGASGRGVVFRLGTTGKETVLHAFTGTSDGGQPQGGLISDSSGNLYGTTSMGGADQVGVAFKLNTASGETVLHSFTGGTGTDDGEFPYAGLIRDNTGNLYGTTTEGGLDTWGVVFKLDAIGNETVLYSFTGGADGKEPVAGLVRSSVGNLFGTTAFGGTHDEGVVFLLGTTGKEIVLHSFTGGADGGQPWASLIRDSAGNFYGTTYSGGSYNAGVVFKLTP